MESKKKMMNPSLDELFDVLDTSGDGMLSLDEVLEGCGKLGMTRMQATLLFRKLDVENAGMLTRDQAVLKPKLTLENLAYLVMEQRVKAEAKVAALEEEIRILKGEKPRKEVKGTAKADKSPVKEPPVGNKQLANKPPFSTAKSLHAKSPLSGGTDPLGTSL